MQEKLTLTKQKIAKILSKILNEKISPDQLSDTTNLVEDIGLNSLNMIYLLVEVEKHLKIKIELERLDVKYFYNLKLLGDFIKSHKSSNT